MEEYIFDGSPHALDAKTAYILKKIDSGDKEFDLDKEFVDMYRKYAEYLYDCNKEKVIEYLMKIFIHHLTFNETIPDTMRIYTPAYLVGPLAEYSTIAIRFQRAEKDNLLTP